MNIIRFCLLLVCFSFLLGCTNSSVGNLRESSLADNITRNSSSKLTEVATPKTIKQLNRSLENRPQVKIVTPQAEQIFDSTDISVRLEVKDFEVFQDEKLQLGNHLNLILDNEPVQTIYSLEKAVQLKNLTPGTHSLRVFAVRSWGESFKNEGAFAQTTFSVLTETNDNRPNIQLPLLTYNQPTGNYGGEPLMLDFYLTNAPLHAVAQSNPEIGDWNIRATVNGDSFLLKDWQPIYLTGLNFGENWIQLELINETGNNIENAFNNTVRVIKYDPQQTNSLSQIFAEQLSLADARATVKQRYYTQPVEQSKIQETPLELTEIEATEVDSANYQNTDETLDKLNIDIDSTENTSINSEAIKPKNEPFTNSDNLKAISSKSTVAIDRSIGDETAEKTVSDVSEPKSAPEIEDNNALTAETTTEELVITKANSEQSQPLDKINIPQPEAVEITEDSITLVIPETESQTIAATENTSDESESLTPLWFKKILVGLRQKLEGFARQLPQKI